MIIDNDHEEWSMYSQLMALGLLRRSLGLHWTHNPSGRGVIISYANDNQHRIASQRQLFLVLPSDVGPPTIVHFLSTSNIWPLYVLAVTNFWLYFVLVLLLSMFCPQNPTFVLIKSTICPKGPHEVQYLSSSLTHFWAKCEATWKDKN